MNSIQLARKITLVNNILWYEIFPSGRKVSDYGFLMLYQQWCEYQKELKKESP